MTTKTVTTLNTALSAETVKTPAQQVKAIKELISKLEAEKTLATESKAKSAAKYARHRLRVARARLAELEAAKPAPVKKAPAAKKATEAKKVAEPAA